MQCDSRECYEKSVELAEKPSLPHAIEVEKVSRGLIETNIAPNYKKMNQLMSPSKS